jgi:hypothetical protein
MFFLFLVADFSFGQYVYSGGTISTPTTWNGYDFYYIDGDILITTGGTLTIAPNTGSSNPVHVVFRGGYGISIEGSGSLSVSGTSSRNIFFTSDRNDNQVYGETGETWKNLSFNESTGTSVIDYAVIEFGTGDSFGLGGGIDIYGNNITISNSTIHDCHLTGNGGGICVDPNGGTNVFLENLILYNNTATGKGGGLFVIGNVNINKCNIYTNASVGLGDGVYLNGSSSIKNSLIYNNSGEGVYSYVAGASLINCLVYGNTTGIYFYRSGFISNCDVVNNTTGVSSESTTAPKLVNSILWGNTNQQYTLISSGKIELAYCGIQGGLRGLPNEINGTKNLNLDSSNPTNTGPNFINPSSNFHLNSWITPLVDGGTPSYSGVTIPGSDLENHSRLSTIDIGAYEFFYYIWTGAISSSWSTSGNWIGSPVSVPTTISENKVAIPNGCIHYPTTSDLELSNRSMLIIEPLAELTVTGATSVGSGCTFLLKSDVNRSANLITGTSVSGSFNVELFLAGGGDPNFKWHYVTTPVNGQGTEVLTTNIVNPYNLLNYDETVVTTDKNAGWQWYDGHNGTTGFGTLNNKLGYNVYVTDNKTAVFTGEILGNNDFVFENSDLTCQSTDPDQNGWNLIGNPFTSGVDAESFVFGQDLIGPGLDKVVYFTKDNGYVTYNTYTHVGTGATRYIPALQGFFVHAKTGRYKRLTIPASGRLSSTGQIYKGTQENVAFPYLKLNISDGVTPNADEAIIYFFDDATTTFDGDYDAYKMLSENPARDQIYTTSSGLKLAINGLPKPASLTVVPLKVWAGETKNYTINVLDLQNLDDFKVTLINGVNRIDLKANPNYTFSATASTLINMAIEFDITTDVNVPEKDLTALWYSNGLISIKTGESGFEDNSTVVIYDINGREVFIKSGFNLGKGETIEIPVHLQNGLYITTVFNDYRKLVKKIAVVE